MLDRFNVHIPGVRSGATKRARPALRVAPGDVIIKGLVICRALRLVIVSLVMNAANGI